MEGRRGDQAMSMLVRSRLHHTLKGLQRGCTLAGVFEALGNLCKIEDFEKLALGPCCWLSVDWMTTELPK